MGADTIMLKFRLCIFLSFSLDISRSNRDAVLRLIIMILWEILPHIIIIINRNIAKVYIPAQSIMI